MCGKLTERGLAEIGQPVNVAVTGSSGTIGSALVTDLEERGHEVARLVRSDADPSDGRFLWDPGTGTLDTRAVEGTEAVVHLAGKPVPGRWTDAHKRSILDSRVGGTRLV